MVYTQAEEAPGSSGWRQEWEGTEKEECPQTIDTGRGPLLPESHVLEQSSEDSENSNLDLVFQVVFKNPKVCKVFMLYCHVSIQKNTVYK